MEGYSQLQGTPWGGSWRDKNLNFLPSLPLDSSLAKPNWNSEATVHQTGQRAESPVSWEGEGVRYLDSAERPAQGEGRCVVRVDHCSTE